MQVNGRPVAAFDPEGLVFSAGVDSEMIKLYDLRSFDKVKKVTEARMDTDNFTLYLLIYIFSPEFRVHFLLSTSKEICREQSGLI
jgi:hypothetical protein